MRGQSRLVRCCCCKRNLTGQWCTCEDTTFLNRLFTRRKDLGVVKLELQSLSEQLTQHAKPACRASKLCTAVTHSGNSMLASSSLSYDTLLAHAPAEESLPKGIVDLVRSCMVQVFPLQVDLWSTILAAYRNNHVGTQQGNRARAHMQKCCGQRSMLDTRQCSCPQLTFCSGPRVCLRDIKVTPGLHNL